MCSIIGYSGKEGASPIIVKGLRRMEYRGYDSVGVATKSDTIEMKKGTGRVDEVNKTVGLDTLEGNVGIGHTRWATHGAVTEINAHPHYSNSGKIAIVHNGIIENYSVLKEQLEKDGYTFQSQTDTEVISNLLQKHYDSCKDVKNAILETVGELTGEYAFIALFEDGTLVAVRDNKSLIIGIGKEEYFLSSDVLGFIENTNDVIYVDNKSVTIIDKNGLNVITFDGTSIKHEIVKVAKEFSDVDKGEYASFTFKEITEQPQKNLQAGDDDTVMNQAASMISAAKNIYITGSGTSFHAALITKIILAKFAKIKIDPILSSEFIVESYMMNSDSLLIAMSQSGESADVLKAVSVAKKSGMKILSIINSVPSELMRESTLNIRMNCGPEIGVAATKSFSAQMVIAYKIANKLCKDCIDIDFEKISKTIQEILDDHSQIKEIVKDLKEISDIYILGRGINYPMALEAALKIKELTYVHAEGMAGGELKHGPLALIDSRSFVMVINPSDSTYEETKTSISEIKTRGAKVIGISDKNDNMYDYWIKIPTVLESVFPLIEIIPIQLFAYYLSIEKDIDPDYPRNLAKSVTVK